jgi:hypothetical protein
MRMSHTERNIAYSPDRYYRSTADGTEGSLSHPVGACSRARVRCYALALENNRFVA